MKKLGGRKAPLPGDQEFRDPDQGSSFYGTGFFLMPSLIFVVII